MKKTVFHKIRRLFRFTLLVCLSLGILSAKAQTARVTLKVQNASLGQVMDEIKNQTRYLFINQDVKDLNNHKVSLNVSDKAIAEVLDQIFTPFNIGYRIEKTSIIIFNRPKSTSNSVLIGGKVSDVGGAPIIGATVLVKGTTNGVSTDADGRFTLTIASPATAQLEISYLGYEPQTLAVGNRTSFEITLAESASEIESVVVTALGIKREEKALSYNVQQVEAEDITTVKDANFMNSLTGKVAGVTINASSSGVGGASKVVLRGNKSISQSSNALYVIDGIPMYNFGGGGGTEFDSKGATEAIADINPEDIESISVLTGAAAAALYGSNAANGAVMITTKKGQAGALKVTLSSNTEFLNPFVQPEFQNRYGTGLNGLQSGSAIYSWGEKLAPAARLGYTPDDFSKVPEETMKLAKVKSGYEQSKSQYELTKRETEHATLVAPFDGIVANLFSKPYNLANTSEAFCTVIDTRGMETDFTVLENELAFIKTGDKVMITPYAGGGSYEGSVSEINPLVDANGMVKVKAAVNGQGKLFSGMNVRVSVKRSLGEQLVIPKTAVVLRSGKQVVFTLKEGKAMWNYVHTGLENATEYVVSDKSQGGVEDGLLEGDTVIVTGNLNLAHETEVTISGE